MSDFDTHFEGIYGARWAPLKEALLKPSSKVSRSCFGGFAEYFLDAASVTVAEQLPLAAGDRVLDMCAAPGGKALVLLENLARVGGELLANELSLARRKRLEEVLRSHVPQEFRHLAKVTGWDGSLVGVKTPGKYDKILLDAPCSSERHLLEQDSSMKEWKISRTKQLGQRQYSMICSAMLALKPGGVLVYSTCSISPLENDAVLERLLDRKGDQISTDPSLGVALRLPMNGTAELNFEETKHGFQIFPDLNQGQGPLYFARLVKNA